MFLYIKTILTCEKLIYFWKIVDCRKKNQKFPWKYGKVFIIVFASFIFILKNILKIIVYIIFDK